MSTRSKWVYPSEKCTPEFFRAFHAACPDVLLIFHPVWHRWQAYEKRTDRHWDAETLYLAIRNHCEHDRDPRHQWMGDARAPNIVFDCAATELGTWMIEELLSKRMDNVHVSREQMLRDAEYSNQRKEHAATEYAGEAAKYASLEGFYRVGRDLMRQDSLAGKRKWVQSVQGSRDDKKGARRVAKTTRA